MATRLDRLFLLLESGSTPVVRRSAAEQLGEVQRLYPHELYNLLTKVHTYLCSSSWETRIAAGQAVEAICKQVPVWEPKTTVEEASETESDSGEKMLLAEFNVSKVLANAKSLLSCEEQEFDLADDKIGGSSKDALRKQRQLLNKRLGLDVGGSLGMDTGEIFADRDLLVSHQSCHSPSALKIELSEVVKTEFANIKGQSAREKNRAKRKAKLMSKADKAENNSDEPDVKKLKKTQSVVVNQPSDNSKILVDNVPDNTLNFDKISEWPFETFCDALLNDLFNSKWETRHGAATGLREVIKVHGHGAGKTTDTSSENMCSANTQWLEDTALRLICVLALDRFGDFVSDEVVAPVRETCAQCLGTVLHRMTVESVQGIVYILLQLLAQPPWEVRHGGLLGIKYMLAVRQDMSEAVLPLVFPAVFRSIQDSSDDVKAVGAASFIPVSDTLVNNMSDQIMTIVDCLWNTLLDLDDLSTSTAAIMALLSALLSNARVSHAISTSDRLSTYIPRLWPFFRHNIIIVRRAALHTLNTILLSSSSSPVWLSAVLQEGLRHVFQRALIEDNKDLLDTIFDVWCNMCVKATPECLIAACGTWLNVWICLLMQPARLPFHSGYLIHAQHRARQDTPTKNVSTDNEQYYIGGSVLTVGSEVESDKVITRARIIGSRLLGQLIQHITRQSTKLTTDIRENLAMSINKLLLFHLSSKSAVQQFTIGLVILYCVQSHQDYIISDAVKKRLLECLSEVIYYDEIAMSFTRMQNECRDFIASLKHHKVVIDSKGSVLSVEQCQAIVAQFHSVKSQLNLKYLQEFEQRCKNLEATVNQMAGEQAKYTLRVQSAIACALVKLNILPGKLNPIVRPLMDSIKREENHQLQKQSAEGLSGLLKLCASRQPCPTPKIIKNLTSFLCSDPLSTPLISQYKNDTDCPGVSFDKYSGIISLSQVEQPIKKVTRGRKPKRKVSVSVDITQMPHENSQNYKQFCLQKRGAECALVTMCENCADKLESVVPKLWETITTPLQSIKNCDNMAGLKEEDGEAQDLINSLQVLETVTPSLDVSLRSKILPCLPMLTSCLEHPYTGVRHMACRCMSMLCKVAIEDTMNHVLQYVLPIVGSSECETRRQGAVEAIANIIESLGVEVVPYIVLMVVPVLGRMSDQNDPVRLMATQCFGTLIRLMPLEAGIPDPPHMNQKLVEQKDQQRKFLEQLLDGSKLENYKMSIPIKAELRKYQQDGLNWLGFLNKYRLHGILCDDMGLGKSLQSICIICSDHHYRTHQYKINGDADCYPLPSIVVCPPTLTGHWIFEVEKFVDKEYLNPLHYTGPPTERIRLRDYVSKHNLVIASYDIVRNDIEFFSKIKWNYCVLDEGHIIKNGKTKISKAVKQLQCNHRLILSGTPIQNNVLELWSLFDFLLPGFLGTEHQFQARFGRPILQSRDAKSSSKEQEAGALAMESLHRQVLPFLLRRLKEDVLQDLPPKIIQDYYCDLSDLQVKLYEDFSKSRANKSAGDSGDTEGDSSGVGAAQSHIFQAIQYLRKLCNHPALVLSSQHPEYSKVCQMLQQQGSSLRDIQHATKLIALKQLLLDCGIGTSNSVGDIPVVNQHRVLLFCQHKSMLDIVEHDLFKFEMPRVTYLRLDGSVPAGSRHSLVNRFNNDPSIDVLLLTTLVGGLGLNLTGADTVIFVEHDWNPMKDLQAMDRAHRIGQKKVVNVYRLITRGTIEEKIMGLQKFKLNIANTVISQENSSLKSMGTDQLLDLFQLDEKSKGHSVGDNQSDSKTNSLKTVLENMTELWDEKEYESEYNMGNFLQSLSSK